jgi:hypothetical protein
MNVLLHAAREGRPIEQTVITTTYTGDNASSHFSSVTDSARVNGGGGRDIAPNSTKPGAGQAAKAGGEDERSSTTDSARTRSPRKVAADTGHDLAVTRDLPFRTLRRT